MDALSQAAERTVLDLYRERRDLFYRRALKALKSGHLVEARVLLDRTIVCDRALYHEATNPPPAEDKK